MRRMFLRKSLSTVILLILVFGSSGSASTQLFPIGKFPPGPIYRTEDLPNLVGKRLAFPTYLVGDFFYMGKVDGKDSFANFTSSMPLRLGNTAVILTFHRNFPPGLVPGRFIKVPTNTPIALTAVKRDNGKIIAFGDSIYK
jgi:hypothetical protein